MLNKYATISISQDRWFKLVSRYDESSGLVEYRIAEFNPASAKYRFITKAMLEPEAIREWRLIQPPIQLTFDDLLSAQASQPAAKKPSMFKRLASFIL